ncbi:hypothetical protein ACNQ1T_02820 [Mycoplasma sp. 1932B]|uniref:hypothetical protein n=1 Tax=Mycoplasma sp. 1932B TaxID=3401670 RepID=UPI003AB0DC8D
MKTLGVINNAAITAASSLVIPGGGVDTLPPGYIIRDIDWDKLKPITVVDFELDKLASKSILDIELETLELKYDILIPWWMQHAEEYWTEYNKIVDWVTTRKLFNEKQDAEKFAIDSLYVFFI